MSARKARKAIARPQVCKAEREVARLERVLQVGAQAAGPHADQNRHKGHRNARGGRQGERRAALAGAY